MFKLVEYRNVYSEDGLFDTSVRVNLYREAMYGLAKEMYKYHVDRDSVSETENGLRYEYRIALIDDDNTVLLSHQTSGYEKIDIPQC